MKKLYFHVDGYKGNLEIPFYRAARGIRESEIEETRRFLGDPKNDQKRIALYVISDFRICKHIYRIDANRRCAFPSYESSSEFSPSEQEGKTRGCLIKHEKAALELEESPNMAFCLPETADEESELEKKMLVLRQDAENSCRYSKRDK